MEEQEGLQAGESGQATQEVFAVGVVRPTWSNRGRGVYAPRLIEAGEIVEVCPVVLVPGPFKDLPREIQRVTFPWGLMSGTGSMHAIAYGYGGIYNHANPANLRYTALVDVGCLQFTAARTILETEELTINFNSLTGDIASDHDTWFQMLDVEPPSAP
jgi:hypothetical protein